MAFAFRKRGCLIISIAYLELGGYDLSAKKLFQNATTHLESLKISIIWSAAGLGEFGPRLGLIVASKKKRN